MWSSSPIDLAIIIKFDRITNLNNNKQTNEPN